MVGDRGCARCGGPLPGPRATYCRSVCRQAAYRARRGSPERRPRERDARPRPFIAVDGEGIGDRLVLLADSTGRTLRRRSGLTTTECLEWLVSGPRGIYVGFGFDWDVNMILRDLEDRKGDPGPEARELWRTGRCMWRGWTIRYVPRKLFSVRRGKVRVTIFDLMGFFSSSFVTACRSFGVEVDPIIEEGKRARSGFSRWTMDRIEAYNAAEVRALALLAERLRERLRAGGLEPTRWHGPGAVATTWIRRVGAAAWVGRDPRRVEDAARRAYFGGRIDAAGYGVYPDAHRYDLRSAYPAVLASLPDLSSGVWRRVEGWEERDGVSLWRVRWRVSLGPGDHGPFPWRDTDGTVLWPARGDGWYHGAEVAAALRRFPAGIEILGGWVYEDDGSRPWRDPIEGLYAERERRKLAGDPSELAFKLVLNSLYGKAAQRRGRSPISSWILAGAITAGCRARISDAIARVERAGGRVLAVMTDGILATATGPEVGDGLGGWSFEGVYPLVLAEPGLYRWGDRLYRRGYEVDADLDLGPLVESWVRGEPRPFPVAVRRFVGLGAACEIDGVYRWRRWIAADRSISPVPLTGTTKRAPEWRGAERWEGMVLLRPYDRGEARYARPTPSRILVSAPYEPRILDPEARRRWLEDQAVPEER